MPVIGLEADIATAAAILVTLVFGALEFRRQRGLRREAAAIELVHSFQSPEFVRASRLVWGLPDALPHADLKARGETVEDAAVTLGMTLETIGVLVYRRIVPLAVVHELMGGAVVVFWRKLEPWVLGERVAQRRESAWEWFQWLAERVAQTEPPEKALGAHVAFREWRPTA